jgi:hypothetical protein
VIPIGISTKLGVAFSVLAALKPVVNQIEALINDTAAHWTTGDKVSLIGGACVAGVTILSRGAQAIAVILRGGSA